MVRKGKDLFVMLAERQKTRAQAASGRAKREPESRSKSKPAKSKPAKSKSSAGKDSSEAGGIGSTLGRWMHGAVRTLRGGEREAPPQRPRTRPGKSSPGRPVPRCLLLPGWMLAAMLIVALGSGFGLGQITFGAKAEEGLNRATQNAEAPARFLQPGQPGYLDDEAAQERLAKFVYVIGSFAPEEKVRATRLAQELRARGLHQTRVMSFQRDGSIFSWATLCYVASYSDKDAVLKDIESHQAGLQFEVDPELKNTPGWPDN
jgi:hypothetical protein